MRDCGGVADVRTAAGGRKEAGAVYKRDLIVSRDLEDVFSISRSTPAVFWMNDDQVPRRQWAILRK